MNQFKLLQLTVLCSLLPFIVSAQLVTDPLPYAPIANPLPDTMDQLYRDSVNIKFSPIRINQAGYRPQDKKYFYFVGSGGTTFSVINEAGASVGSGTLRSTGQTVSGQLKIKASNNATLVSGGDTRYLMDSPVFSGNLSEGLIPDLPPGVYRVVVGNATSVRFVIDERVYSWVRDALLKFYGVNRCGDSQSWFHPPCHLKDAATGGWHDCGDHLKEGATMSYAAAVLGLAAAAFFDRDADVYSANQGITQITDGIPDILYEAKHGADFILQSYDKAAGQVGSMITSMGGFGNAGCGDDHSWWGRPEYQDKMPVARGGAPRCARNEPTTDYLAKYAANLAFVSKRMRPYDAAYADRCLKAAKAIYDYTKVKLNITNTAAYNGATIVTDDAAFGCLALLWATGERKYLDELCYDKSIGSKASTNDKLFQGGWFAANDPVFSHTSANTDWASTQSHVLWGFFKLILSDTALCTNLNLTSQSRLALVEKTVYNLVANLSSVGLGNNSIQLPDNGFWVPPIIKYERPWFTMQTQMEWVWNRYQAGNITEMYYYYDIASKIQGMALPNTPASADWKADTVKTILVRMLDYMIGVNPWDISMIYGVGEKNFNHPHHRAANPEGKNVPGAFYNYCPPVGALQGGYKPVATGSSVYSEHFDDYMHSETGIDGTTNILMPVIGLAKEDTILPPTGTVRIIYVGCDEAIVEVRQTRFGNAEVHYGTTGTTYSKVVKSDSADVLHRIVLSGLTRGTDYNFEVLVTDMFGRDSVIKYLNEEKKLVDFTFTTLQNCPTNANIQSVKVCRVTFDSAEIFWYTPNGEFDSKVVYGTQKPPTTVHDGDVAGHPVKFHNVKIGGLTEKTTYYFYVESGESRDDNNGELYQFTTPVEHVNFDVRAVRYTWEGMPTIGLNIMNQDIKSYDSLELRLYVRGPETYTLKSGTFGRTSDTVVRFQDHIMFRVDIGIKYRSDGYQDKHFKTELDKYVQSVKPIRIEDTYDAATNTWGYYIPVPMGNAVMESGARFRIDISMLARSPFYPYLDAWTSPSLKEITNADWSFGPHSVAKGDPYDYAGVPISTKEAVDSDNFNTPINYYITVYRKNEYVWGYSPSHAELETKKTQYFIQSQVTSPLNNPTADYVFYERPIRSVPVSGWATVDPIDGTLNDIWVNGVRQTNISGLFAWNEKDKRYDFTIPVPVQNGRNNVDITLFAGPKATCDSCYGCAVSNHSFFVEFQGAKQYPSQLVLRDRAMLPISDTVKLDTTEFNVIVTDRNGNQNGKAIDVVTVRIKNFDNGDSITVSLSETGDSTGIFETDAPIAVVDRTPASSGKDQIAMNGGDKVRIWYVDPTDETDSSEAYITSKANFPLARRGWLKDIDGNGAVDMLMVEYSTALKQNIDSISVNFPNATTMRMTRATVDATTFTGNTVTVIFKEPPPAGVTGFSSALYSSGISYLTSNGLVKASNFPLYDSVGPVLNGQVEVRERPEAGNDTLTIQLSESVKIDKLIGSVLFLRRAGVDYPVEVLGIIGSGNGGLIDTVICNAGGMNFAAGDSVRFNSASELSDLSLNRSHPQNRAVPIVIKAGLARILYAYYLDSDYNGIIDIVRVGFSKAVIPGNLDVGLKWNTNPKKMVGDASIVLSEGSSTEITVRVDSTLTNKEVVTAGSMLVQVVQAASLLDTVFSDVADSAAPVIATARFTLFNGDISAGIVDTLRLTFSEAIDFNTVTAINAFNMKSISLLTGYNFTVSGRKTVSQREYVFYGVADGAAGYPAAGDLIWLQHASRVTDLRGNVQMSENNRHVPVIVDEVAFSLKDVEKSYGPNPFNPNYQTFIVSWKVKASRFPFQIDSTARGIIYDKVGNVVAEIKAVSKVGGIELSWKGHNRKGRIVGNGTYLFQLIYKDEQETQKIGVDRR